MTSSAEHQQQEGHGSAHFNRRARSIQRRASHAFQPRGAV
jgi:hypothetical protein